MEACIKNIVVVLAEHVANAVDIEVRTLAMNLLDEMLGAPGRQAPRLCAEERQVDRLRKYARWRQWWEANNDRLTFDEKRLSLVYKGA